MRNHESNSEKLEDVSNKPVAILKVILNKVSTIFFIFYPIPLFCHKYYLKL